jgi:hypothetical protein
LAEVSLVALLALLASLIGARALAPVWVGRVALLIGAAHVVGAFTRYAASIQLGRVLELDVWMLGFSNPRVASSYYALLMPFVASALSAQTEPDPRLRAVAWAVLVGLWTVAVGLQARALWFSYALAVPCLFAIAGIEATRPLAVRLLLCAVAGFALHFALSLAVGAGPPGIIPRHDLYSMNSREILWGLAADAMLAHIVLGLGPGQFASLQSFAGAHPHNWVLQLGAEWGVPALLIAVVALAALITRVGREFAQAPQPLLAVATRSVLVGLASALVDGTLVMPSTQTAFAVALGLLIGQLRAASKPATPGVAQSRGIGLATAAAAVGAALWLSLHSLSSYASQEAELRAFHQRFPGKWLVPRLWENGLPLANSQPGKG